MRIDVIDKSAYGKMYTLCGGVGMCMCGLKSVRLRTNSYGAPLVKFLVVDDISLQCVNACLPE